MKTRKELIAEVEELARELGEEISTDRMNNAALVELVATLRARLEERTQPPAPPVDGAQPAPAREAAPPVRTVQPDQARPPPPIVHDVAPVRQVVDGAADAAAGGQPAPAAEPPKPPRAPYYVAAGRSIVASGRVLGPFKPVKSTDLPGGQKDLDYFVLKGAVVRST